MHRGTTDVRALLDTVRDLLASVRELTASRPWSTSARRTYPQDLHEAAGRGALARGLGRSYGDAAQNGGGLVVRLAGSIDDAVLDRTTATLTVGAGVSIDDVLCPDHGRCPPVVDGMLARYDGVHYTGAFSNAIVPMIVARAERAGVSFTRQTFAASRVPKPPGHRVL